MDYRTEQAIRELVKEAATLVQLLQQLVKKKIDAS